MVRHGKLSKDEKPNCVEPDPKPAGLPGLCTLYYVKVPGTKVGFDGVGRPIKPDEALWGGDMRRRRCPRCNEATKTFTQVIDIRRDTQSQLMFFSRSRPDLRILIAGQNGRPKSNRLGQYWKKTFYCPSCTPAPLDEDEDEDDDDDGEEGDSGSGPSPSKKAKIVSGLPLQ